MIMEKKNWASRHGARPVMINDTNLAILETYAFLINVLKLDVRTYVLIRLYFFFRRFLLALKV